MRVNTGKYNKNEGSIFINHTVQEQPNRCFPQKQIGTNLGAKGIRHSGRSSVHSLSLEGSSSNLPNGSHCNLWRYHTDTSGLLTFLLYESECRRVVPFLTPPRASQVSGLHSPGPADVQPNNLLIPPGSFAFFSYMWSISLIQREFTSSTAHFSLY